MKKNFALTLLLSSFAVNWCAASEATNVVVISPEYLSALAAEMRTNLPSLQAADARADAAKENVRTISTWEDPTARIGFMGAREEMRADEGDVIYGVEEKLPLFGKPESARRVAQAELAMENANTDYQFQVSRADLAKLLFAAALANQNVVIAEQDLGWLDLAVQTADAKYRAGQATLVELLLLKNERAKRTTELETDREELMHRHVALNRILNRSPHSPWPDLELPPLAGPVSFSSRLVELAFNHEPKLRVLERQTRRAEAALDATRRERFPDVNVGLEARNFSGDGSVRQGMLVLSMNLPWANREKYRGAIQRDQANLKAAELDAVDYQASLRETIHELTLKIDAARRNALLYRDEILPRSQSALESSRAGWEASQSPFRDMLDARRMLLDARLSYARAISEQYQLLSELALRCGLENFSGLERMEQEIGEAIRSKSDLSGK
ncbi:MAG TPA: TolC family protein [Verrucomicrobiae bacterium]|nr:TolC family protein [Verrucomicrobiae bacterium]